VAGLPQIRSEGTALQPHTPTDYTDLTAESEHRGR